MVQKNSIGERPEFIPAVIGAEDAELGHSFQVGEEQAPRIASRAWRIKNSVRKEEGKIPLSLCQWWICLTANRQRSGNPTPSILPGW